MLRQFAVLCLLVFGGMAIWQGAVRHHPLAAALLGVLALALGSIGWVRPQALRPLFVAWMYAAFPVGWLVAHLLLGMIFFGLFTPLAIVFRIMGRDALMLRRGNQASYWLPKPQSHDKRRYFSQF
jgi:hypothetical protein